MNYNEEIKKTNGLINSKINISKDIKTGDLVYAATRYGQFNLVYYLARTPKGIYVLDDLDKDTAYLCTMAESVNNIDWQKIEIGDTLICWDDKYDNAVECEYAGMYEGKPLVDFPNDSRTLLSFKHYIYKSDWGQISAWSV